MVPCGSTWGRVFQLPRGHLDTSDVTDGTFARWLVQVAEKGLKRPESYLYVAPILENVLEPVTVSVLGALEIPVCHQCLSCGV